MFSFSNRLDRKFQGDVYIVFYSLLRGSLEDEGTAGMELNIVFSVTSCRWLMGLSACLMNGRGERWRTKGTTRKVVVSFKFLIVRVMVRVKLS